jgi:hypothetical protein
VAGKGQPKTGGRKKGVGNLRARYLSEQAAKSGLTPRDYLLGVLRDPQASIERRDWAAATLAPYVHPRLAAIEAKVDAYNTVEMRVTRAELAAQAKRRIDEAFREYSPPQTIDHVPPSVDTPATLPEPPPQEPEPKREPVVREYAGPGPLAAAPGVTRLPMRYRPPRPVGDWSG